MPAPLWKGTFALIEQSNSPRWRFSRDEVTLVREFRGPYSVCLASAPGYGAIAGGGMKVLESTAVHERGGIGVLTISYGPDGEAVQNVALPPDTESLERSQVEYAIEKHPLFVPLGNQILTDIRTIVERSSDDDLFKSAALRLLQLTGQTKQLADKLARKLIQGILFFVEYPPVYQRVSYSWTEPQNLSGGGRIETPVTVGLTLPSGFSYLRAADNTSFNGTFWETRRLWNGSRYVDADLYP